MYNIVICNLELQNKNRHKEQKLRQKEVYIKDNKKIKLKIHLLICSDNNILIGDTDHDRNIINTKRILIIVY